MINVNDFKTGLTVEVDGDIFTVLDFQHVKPGKGAAFVRSKLKTCVMVIRLNVHSVRVKQSAGRKSKIVVYLICMLVQTIIHSWTTKHMINLHCPAIS